MVNPNLDGLDDNTGGNETNPEVLDAQLSHPTDEGLFYIISALGAGYTVNHIRRQVIPVQAGAHLRQSVPKFSLDTLKSALKVNGFSDRQNAPPICPTHRPCPEQNLYMTYGGSDNGITTSEDEIVVLGCGAYCTGRSVELDCCGVSGP
ncbi:hypothetical protein PI124_g18589 [Phytophthora idaei]|nr:hypothetical protein PI125_g21674 [Phytophthora idaei]KAG3131473.1 hypothetical protein PI126_g20040 [Phytophthora idaei]KAG3236402.1 hypothetical protein PI124_g18589 [Phytophthora idaei]